MAVLAGDVGLLDEGGGAVDVGDGELAAGGDRGVGLVDADLGAGDDGGVVAAGDGNGDGLWGAQCAAVILGLVGEGDVAADTGRQAVEVVARIEGIAAIGVEGQRAVAGADTTGQLVTGNDAVDIAGRRDLAIEDGVFFGRSAAGLSDRCVVATGDCDGDGLRIAQCAAVIFGLVGKGDVTADTSRQAVEVVARIEAIAAIGIEGQRAVAGADTIGQLVTGNGAVDIAGRRDLAVEDGVLFGRSAARLSYRCVVGAGHGDGDGLRIAQRTTVILGLIGEGDVTTDTSRQTVEVLTRIEAIAAIGIEGQRAIAGADIGSQLVAGNGAIDIARGRDLAIEDGVLFGRSAASLGDRCVVGAGNGQRQGAGVGGAMLVGDDHRNADDLRLAFG